jgi:hypothetical protein
VTITVAQAADSIFWLWAKQGLSKNV